MARDTPYQLRRKEKAGYVSTAQREGCRTCAFSTLKIYGPEGRLIKDYYCGMGNFFTSAAGICEKYVKKEKP